MVSTSSISLDRFVFGPTVAVTAKTVMHFNDLESSVDAIGVADAAEVDGSPLSELFARIMTEDGNADDITEFAGRQCYKSWKHGRPNDEYIANIIRDAHGSVMEHANIVFQVTGVSRSLTHELIRHRVGTAYSQESQRYVDMADMKFIVPPIILTKYVTFPDRPTDEELLADDEFVEFAEACMEALGRYSNFQAKLRTRLNRELEAAKIELGEDSVEFIKRKTSVKKRANEAARAVLPNASQTQLIFTTNIRALRHIVELRGSVHADLEIRRFAKCLLVAARPHAPHSLDDLEISADAGDEHLRGILRRIKE